VTVSALRKRPPNNGYAKVAQPRIDADDEQLSGAA
jgi:hypothetical protein